MKVSEEAKDVLISRESESKNVPASVAQRNTLLNQPPKPEALQLIPESMARHYDALPLAIEGNTLRVAMANPDDIAAIDMLAVQSKKKIVAIKVKQADIRQCFDLYYKAFDKIASQFGELVLPKETEFQGRKTDIARATSSPVGDALNLVIQEAIKSRASDIHIAVEEEGAHIRFRIDGVLREIASIPTNIVGQLLSRIKIMADMNIAERRRPQDGHFSYSMLGREIDVRVATLNTVQGEAAVLRLLDKSVGALSLSELGLLRESQQQFERIAKLPYGMVLASGPTGAGKTTTLYSLINTLDRVGHNIVTIEDPVEYQLHGVRQIQVNQKAGLTFASGLRAIVRFDPDVILVGEIRDSETAKMAVQAALTGHLVLSSVHANDTVGALLRLVDLGVEPFLICSSLSCIVAQRMVRKVCPHCGSRRIAPLAEQMAYYHETGDDNNDFMYGTGCDACMNSGYLGRTGIFEILPMSDNIRELLIKSATAAEIRARAIDEGMVTLARDGMLKAKDGITTPDEVLRTAYSII